MRPHYRKYVEGVAGRPKPAILPRACPEHWRGTWACSQIFDLERRQGVGDAGAPRRVLLSRALWLLAIYSMWMGHGDSLNELRTGLDAAEIVSTPARRGRVVRDVCREGRRRASAVEGAARFHAAQTGDRDPEPTNFPVGLFHPQDTALCSSRRAAANDVQFVREAGLKTVVCIDTDREKVALMRPKYPAEWTFLVEDAFEYMDRELPRGANYDIVMADPWTGLMDDKIRELDRRSS